MPEEITVLAEQVFRDLLNAAITHGRRPGHTPVLGAASWIAIDLVAREHPDAAPEQIIRAYDAFAHEHRGDAQVPVTVCADPVTARAAEYATIDNLVAQLRITYPDVEPTVLAAIVRRIHTDFDNHRIRDFVPMFVEHAALKELA